MHECGRRSKYMKTKGKCHSGQTHSTVFGYPREAPVPLDSSCQLIPVAICTHLERPGTWLHGGSVERDVGFPDMPQLPPEHGCVAGGYLLLSRQERASKPHAHQTW